MDLAESLKHLIELQGMDSGLDELEKLQKGFRQKIADLEKGTDEAKSRLEAGKRALDALLKERKTVEIEVGSLETKIKKYQSQESEVKSNEQFLALKHETERGKEDKGKAEERVLDLMFREDEARKQVQALEQELRAAEAGLAKERQDLEGRIADCAKAAEDKRKERQAKAALVPEDLSKPYQALRDRGKKIAAAAVLEDGTCEGCKMRIPPQVLNEIKKAMSVPHCDCGRFLYTKV